jgi:hypothetical protein
MNKILAFKIGRGGQSNNPGYLSYLGELEISEVISKYELSLFLKHENESDFKHRFGWDDTYRSNTSSILDMIQAEDYYNLEELYGITEHMLGKRLWYTQTGHCVGLRERDSDIGIGHIDIDGEYESYYTCEIDDCDEKELKAIKKANWSSNNDIIEYIEDFLN